MNNFGGYLTPEEADGKTIDQSTGAPILREEIQVLANAPDSLCENCQVESVWKAAGTGLCFSCTTGEADASDDYELMSKPE